MKQIFTYLFTVTILVLGGCGAGNASGVTAINLQTGELHHFDSENEVPHGWVVCVGDAEGCPDPVACNELNEANCLVRTDCTPTYAEGSPESENPFLSCNVVPSETECSTAECRACAGSSLLRVR